MGSCCSTAEPDRVNNRRAPSDNPAATPGVPTGGNKPLVPPSTLAWTAEEGNRTLTAIRRQREGFWDTQPAYSGRAEIWSALRLACDCLLPQDGDSITTQFTPDLASAQAILDSTSITVPTGKLSDGCYDELGNCYVIPLFCFVLPTNVMEGVAEVTNDRQPEQVPESIGQSTAAPQSIELNAGGGSAHSPKPLQSSLPLSSSPPAAASIKESPPSSPVTPISPSITQGPCPLLVRLSTGDDITLRVPTSLTVQSLHTLLVNSHLASLNSIHSPAFPALTDVKLRFFHLGRELKSEQKIENLSGIELRDGSDPVGVIQVMVQDLRFKH